MTGPSALRRRLDRTGSDSGQATVEFALSLVLLLAFLLFFLQVSVVFAFGNYVHYATFMSARALLSAGDSRDDQELRARTYMERMVKKPGSPERDRYPLIAKGYDGDGVGGAMPGFSSDFQEFEPKNKDKSWLQGVRYGFRSRIFMLPLAGKGDTSSQKSQGNHLELTSESFLGREPNYDDCMTYMRAFGQQPGKDWLIDNGC